MKEKVVLVGAGSAMFTKGLVADLISRGWDAELALVDTSTEALEAAEGLARKMVEARKAKIAVSASTDRKGVLAGATVVICTVGVGGRRAWEKDVAIPRKYGVFQPVGDSVMPGGTSRALRMIPPMVDIATDVLELAPDALFFNYGNPMACVCRAIRKATGAPVTGLCIGVHGVAGYLAGALGVDVADLAYTAVGMNHLTWFTELRLRGEDAMPRLHEIARERLGRDVLAEDSGGKLVEAGDLRPGEMPPSKDHPFSWHLLELFGAFPAVLDAHVTEFFPWLFPKGSYYGHTLGKDMYSVEEVIAWGDSIYESMRKEARSGEPLPADFFEHVTGEHERVLEIIESIRKDDGAVYSANLPNTGQVPNLPRGAVLESPAVATAAGLRPIAQPPLPSGIAGTLATRLQWVETTVEAALEGSREKFIQALVLDGSVDSLEAATALADELLRAHAEHLPQFRAAGGPG
ncbi:MAG: family 4 glycosyl hydrolase [Planctomycetota bacterium]|jgi:alpha-galactosidase